MRRRPPRSTPLYSSAASDVYKRQPSDGDARGLLADWVASSAGTIAIESVADEWAATWSPPAATAPVLSAAVFDRRLDTVWRRTSYTGLTARLHDAARVPGVGSEPEVEEQRDEPALPSVLSPTAPP